MNAAPSLHPTDQTLSSYGLGKLDDRAAEAVNEHLMECTDCRKRVAEMSADSFLHRVRDAQKPSDKSISGQPRVGGTLSDKVTNTLTSSSADSLPPGLAAHPDYEIKRELGRGGMGVVYLAHNTLMNRYEVLKVMGQHLMDSPGVLERFLREIQSVAKLRHPNIVTAYHASRLGQSIVFAMEYVEGLDLSNLVKSKGPTPVAHACLFIHQAALGLQHAREEGLIHRDIKPHNLMLSRKGDKATVKILDFGLAKAAREEKVEGGLTATGQALGTPDYIAPEQIINAQTADIRADIYSLGGTLYYLLTGRPPFQAKSLYDLYQAHISREADPLNLIRPDVPAELAALVAKMMAKDPSRRFQTPGEVAQALKPFCTKANAALKTIKADVSQVDPAKAGRSVAEAASAATQVETDAERRLVRPRKVAESSVAESRWESMIDFRETDGSQEAAPNVSPSRRSPWMWPSVAVGVSMLGLFAAWMGGVFKVKTPDGVIVLENVPKDSEILVDGSKITFTWPGGGKPVEIRAVPGQHRVEVNQEGFRTFGQDVTFKTEGSEEVRVRLEPIVAVRPEPKKNVSPEPKADEIPEPKTEVVVSRPPNDDADASGLVPLFNGKDLSGWVFPLGKESAWTVDDGVIRGKTGVTIGSASTIVSARSDYKDFHLRMEMYKRDYGAYIHFRSENTQVDYRYYRFDTGSVLHDGTLTPLGTYEIKTAGGPGEEIFVTNVGIQALRTPEMLPLTKNTWHVVEVIAVGNIFTMKVDGREVSAFEDTRSRLKQGQIAISLGKGVSVDIRRIEIKELNVSHRTPNPEADSENAARIGPTAITEELLGVITKVDVAGKMLTIESNDGKIVHLSTNGNTEIIGGISKANIGMGKLSEGLTTQKAKGKKGVRVKVSHAQGVASKVSIGVFPAK